LGAEATVASQRVYEGRLINLRADTVRLENGRLTKREIVEHPGAVAVVALDEDDNVILIRQFRKAAGKELLEIPAGTLEADEEPIACARRELEEETGYRAKCVEQVGGFYSSPGFCNEYIHLYLATDLQKGRSAPEDDEAIEIIQVALSDIPALISQGEICDGKTIAGLLNVLLLRHSFDFSDR
jgi:ADP-ribose pyrophosphatase